MVHVQIEELTPEELQDTPASFGVKGSGFRQEITHAAVVVSAQKVREVG